MDIKKYMKVVPAVAVLLLASACNQNLEPAEDTQPRIIPYSVSAVSDIETRATLDGENNYQFETGDKLYVWGEDISGELTRQGSGTAGEATFSGNLTWTGGGEDPADDLTLNAVLVGPEDRVIGEFGSFLTNVHVDEYAPDYLAAGFASSYTEAVQYFSYLRTESTYGAKSFNFFSSQRSAFISFVITLEDGTAGGTSVDVSILNSGGVISSDNVMTSQDGGVVTVSLIAPVLGGTELNGAAVQLGEREVINFGGDNTLYGNTVYRVKKTYTRYSITASANIPIVGEKSKTSYNKPMGYTTKLSDLLNEMDAGSAASMVSGCTRTSGTSVDVSPIGEPATDYEFTVAGEGDSVFDMVVKLSASISQTVPVTITVAKMTPPEP